MKLDQLGLPYMGSKRKLAKPIINFIMKENPNTRYFYDLFGGGGAISFEALRVKSLERVIYNELNTSITELLKDIFEDGITDKYYQWIDRETFQEHKKDPTWFGGLCSTVWSFGNKGHDYIYGKEVEEDKHLLHKIVVDKDIKSLKIFNKKYNMNLKIEISSFFGETLKQRRLRIMGEINKQAKKQYLERLEHLERLQHLLQLEQLKWLYYTDHHRLEISNKSYDHVEITTPKEETIIYCDPPYVNTGEYLIKDFNYEKFYSWVENNPYKIYISSYESHLPCVLEMKHRTTVSATTNNVTIEKLFVNKL